MSERNAPENRNKSRFRPPKWFPYHIPLLGGGAVACVALGVPLALFASASGNDFQPPVVHGVPEEIVIEEDTSPADRARIILEGITVTGGEDRPDVTFPVTFSVYPAQEDPAETPSQMPLAACSPGTYRLVYTGKDENGNAAEPVESVLIVQVADHEPPVITGVQDLTIEAGQTITYRNGVTVTDNLDTSVALQVDASKVDTTQPGEYSVLYSAEDSRGNRTSVAAQVTVLAPPPAVETPVVTSAPEEEADPLWEPVNEMADQILSQILKEDMSLKQKAEAIFYYVQQNIRYVGTSDKSSWLVGAYNGFLKKRGDCYNYFACSKALLTRAGIPNIDLARAGGDTDHYWQLVDVGEGYYHFDACPHPSRYPLHSFLLTEAEVRDYTKRCSQVRSNYYVYDYAACPVTVVGTPEGEDPKATPTATPETAPETTPDTTSEITSEPSSLPSLPVPSGQIPNVKTSVRPKDSRLVFQTPEPLETPVPPPETSVTPAPIAETPAPVETPLPETPAPENTPEPLPEETPTPVPETPLPTPEAVEPEPSIETPVPIVETPVPMFEAPVPVDDALDVIAALSILP